MMTKSLHRDWGVREKKVNTNAKIAIFNCQNSTGFQRREYASLGQDELSNAKRDLGSDHTVCRERSSSSDWYH